MHNRRQFFLITWLSINYLIIGLIQHLKLNRVYYVIVGLALKLQLQNQSLFRRNILACILSQPLDSCFHSKFRCSLQRANQIPATISVCGQKICPRISQRRGSRLPKTMSSVFFWIIQLNKLSNKFWNASYSIYTNRFLNIFPCS